MDYKEKANELTLEQRVKYAKEMLQIELDFMPKLIELRNNAPKKPQEGMCGYMAFQKQLSQSRQSIDALQRFINQHENL